MTGRPAAGRASLRAVALLLSGRGARRPGRLHRLQRTFEPGIGEVWDSITTPEAVHAFWLTLEVTAIAVPLNAIVGVLAALAARARPGTRQAGRRARSSTCRSRSRRWSSASRSCSSTGGRAGSAPMARERRRPGALPLPGDRSLATIFVIPAVRRPRGHARAARDRRRAGAGGFDARGIPLADVLADHAAGDPLGRWSTASSSPRRARSGSSARSASCPASSSGQTETLTLLVEDRFDRTSTSPGPTPPRRCWRCIALL